VWHASVSRPGWSYEKLKPIALRQLRSVGDAHLGEWEEWTGRALHIRRRLTAEEQGSLDMLDIRNSPEYGVRRAAIAPYLPVELADWQE